MLLVLICIASTVNAIPIAFSTTVMTPVANSSDDVHRLVTVFVCPSSMNPCPGLSTGPGIYECTSYLELEPTIFFHLYIFKLGSVQYKTADGKRVSILNCGK